MYESENKFERLYTSKNLMFSVSIRLTQKDKKYLKYILKIHQIYMHFIQTTIENRCFADKQAGMYL